MPRTMKAEVHTVCQWCAKSIQPGMMICLDLPELTIGETRKEWMHRRCWYRKHNPKWLPAPATTATKA